MIRPRPSPRRSSLAAAPRIARRPGAAGYDVARRDRRHRRPLPGPGRLGRRHHHGHHRRGAPRTGDPLRWRRAPAGARRAGGAERVVRRDLVAVPARRAERLRQGAGGRRSRQPARRQLRLLGARDRQHRADRGAARPGERDLWLGRGDRGGADHYAGRERAGAGGSGGRRCGADALGRGRDVRLLPLGGIGPRGRRARSGGRHRSPDSPPTARTTFNNRFRNTVASALLRARPGPRTDIDARGSVDRRAIPVSRPTSPARWWTGISSRRTASSPSHSTRRTGCFRRSRRGCSRPLRKRHRLGRPPRSRARAQLAVAPRCRDGALDRRCSPGILGPAAHAADGRRVARRSGRAGGVASSTSVSARARTASRRAGATGATISRATVEPRVARTALRRRAGGRQRAVRHLLDLARERAGLRHAVHAAPGRGGHRVQGADASSRTSAVAASSEIRISSPSAPPASRRRSSRISPPGRSRSASPDSSSASATWSSSPSRSPNPGDPNYVNIAEANADGIETVLELRNVGPLAGGLSYTWLDTDVEDAGFSVGADEEFVEGLPLIRRAEALLLRPAQHGLAAAGAARRGAHVRGRARRSPIRPVSRPDPADRAPLVHHPRCERHGHAASRPARSSRASGSGPGSRTCSTSATSRPQASLRGAGCVLVGVTSAIR